MNTSDFDLIIGVKDNCCYVYYSFKSMYVRMLKVIFSFAFILILNFFLMIS